MQKFEYATLEWLWDSNAIRINFPNGQERQEGGTYAEVVRFLTEIGQEGWEVITCTSGGNWLFWTLKRHTG